VITEESALMEVYLKLLSVTGKYVARTVKFSNRKHFTLIGSDWVEPRFGLDVALKT
jgi:hypothetical protein